MQVFQFLVLVACASSSRLNFCMNCVDQSMVFTVNVFPHSDRPYACIKHVRDIRPGDHIVKTACVAWDCLLLAQQPHKVYNKTNMQNLCEKSDLVPLSVNPSCNCTEPESVNSTINKASTHKLYTSLVLLVFPVLFSYHEW